MSNPSTFIGRKNELRELKNLLKLQRAALVVIKGRRRVGKSRLAAECAKGKRFLNFCGLPPTEGVTAQTQRDHFSQQLATHLNETPTHFDDWFDALNYLSKNLDSRQTVVLFDEISWMGAEDPLFVPKMKSWWDQKMSLRPGLVLIFCGSVSTWIEKNIINSTAFFGRITLPMTLDPLSLPECGQFLRAMGFDGSNIEVYQILSTLGGIPWYLEQIQTNQSVAENIRRLCFKKNGLLLHEFDHIFHDLFDDRGSFQRKILDALDSNTKLLSEMRTDLQVGIGGTLSECMQQLITCGFVSKQAQWSFATGAIKKQSLYRISDPFVRFYLKYMEPHLSEIEKGRFNYIKPNRLPGFDAQIGLQVENLLLENSILLLNAMGIDPLDIVMDGPYRQTATERTQGCQIDYLVQMNTKTLFVCEFKFSRNPLDAKVIDEMKEKIKRISAPRGFAIVPVLMHIGDLPEAIYSSRYFYRTIDIAQFLDEPEVE